MAINSKGIKSDKFAKNSKARDDMFDMLADEESVFIFDVMANDVMGKSKTLWSIDDSEGDEDSGPADLLSRDEIAAVNFSEKGAEIWITEEGKVAYALTPDLQAELEALADGEYLIDTFTYAMRQGQGHSPLNWATATVTFSGVNDPPELTSTPAVLIDGTENAPYTILASDLLAGYTDVDGDTLSISDLTATHGTLTETTDGWIFIPEENFVGTVDLSYKVIDGQGGSINATQSFLLAPVLDVTAPLLVNSEPPDDSTEFQVSNDIVLYFDEAITVGMGDIIISNGSDTHTIAVDDPDQVTLNGSKLTINPEVDLIPNTTYNIQMAEGVITDTAGNAYAGINDASTLNFTTIADTIAPWLSFSTPWDNSTFKSDDNIELNFSERVMAGHGDIIISNGTDTRIISVNDSGQVTFNNSKLVTINPEEDLIPNTTYNIQMAEGVIVDTAGNPYEGISDDKTLNFTTIPATPLLWNSNPWDDSVDFQVDSNIEFYFDEAVLAGSGAIIISNGADTRTIDINDTSQVTFDGYGGVIINLTEDLLPNTTYNVQMTNGVITDMAGNPYAGISDDTTLNFTTVPTNPFLYWSYPWDESTEFQIDNNIELYFNETVIAGSGDIIISNGADVRAIDINDTNQVTFDGYGGVIINPEEDLVPNTTYHIQIDSGVITDLTDHAYAGIDDDSMLNFTTIPSNPLLLSSYPSDDFTELQTHHNIELYFNETVMPGNGSIIISNGTDTRAIDINDASQIIFDGYSGVIINPTEDLAPNSTYNIQISSGVITDLAGHAYVGINDDTTLNFTTILNPLLMWSNPWDDSTEFQVDSNIEFYFDEPIMAGTGDIIISNGTDTRTIAINDASQVTFDGYSGVIIDPTEDLLPNTTYNVQIASGVITDVAGNPYAGISDDTTLNFTTIPTNPVLMNSTPIDDATDVAANSDITLYFNEWVMEGNGTIIISNGSDTRAIDINDFSQVTFNGSKVIINPTEDLVSNTTYNIQMAEGVITDVAGNTYAGISDDTTLNFTTVDPMTATIIGVADPDIIVI